MPSNLHHNATIMDEAENLKILTKNHPRSLPSWSENSTYQYFYLVGVDSLEIMTH